jgi:hypothetical protein
MLATVSRAPLSIGLAAAPLAAEFVRIEVHSRADVVNGRTFGTAGPYEKARRKNLLRRRKPRSELGRALR